MADSLEIDVFWSFRSPWSYLATPRLVEYTERYELRVNFRPVYPIAVRTPEFFQNVHPQWFGYFMRDVHRVAEFLELPFRWPRPDPIVASMGDDGRPVTAEHQPYIHRLTRAGIVAEEQGRGLAFADEISRLIWSGTENWHEGVHLSEATARAGLDLSELDATAEAETERLEAVIAANQSDHEQAGHWGVPTVAFQGEAFFGQDRLDVLLWRLRQHGLRERASA